MELIESGVMKTNRLHLVEEFSEKTSEECKKELIDELSWFIKKTESIKDVQCKEIRKSLYKIQEDGLLTDEPTGSPLKDGSGSDVFSDVGFENEEFDVSSDEIDVE